MDFHELNCSFSLSLVILRFTLVVLLLLFAYTPVEGQFQVIGSHQPIVVAAGDDVILPCHVEPRFDVAGLTVEWSKPDLKPDPNDRLSRVDYVYLYRDTQEVRDMQITAYMERTTLFTDGLRQGNISLKITNVTLADEGRYRCFIPKLKGQTKSSIVRLVVEMNSTKTTEALPQPRHLPTPDPNENTDVTGGLSSRSRVIPVVIFLVVSLILFGGATLYLTKKCHKLERREHYPTPEVQGFRPASPPATGGQSGSAEGGFYVGAKQITTRKSSHLQLVDVTTSTSGGIPVFFEKKRVNLKAKPGLKPTVRHNFFLNMFAMDSKKAKHHSDVKISVI